MPQPPSSSSQPPSPPSPPPRAIAAVYPYRDATGRLLYEVVRFVPKAFACRRPAGAAWRWNLQGVERVLYRLPEILQAIEQHAMIFLTEGEKDADALIALGLAATTHAGGAGKWRPEYSQAFRGARVVLLPDNDEPGRHHMDEVARSLEPVAVSLSRLELPGLPDKGDVSDWVAARRADGLANDAIRDQLVALAQARRTADTAPAPPAADPKSPSHSAAPVATALPAMDRPSAAVATTLPATDRPPADVAASRNPGVDPGPNLASPATIKPGTRPRSAPGTPRHQPPGGNTAVLDPVSALTATPADAGAGAHSPAAGALASTPGAQASAAGAVLPDPSAPSSPVPTIASAALQPRPAPPRVRRLSEVTARPVHFLWAPYLPLGKLTLLDGDPGQGKSWLTAAIATAGSHGRGLPGTASFEPFTTIFFTEDPAEDVLRPRLDLLGADCSRIWTYDAFDFPVDLSQPADVAKIDELVPAYRARLIVIDPIQAFLGAKTDIYRPNEVRSVLAPLLRLAQRHACALLVLRHITKARASRCIYAGQGSVDFIAAARSVLLAGSGPDDPTRHALVHIKSNLAAAGPTLGYRFDGQSFVWEGPSVLTANDLLAAELQTDDAGAEQEARLFLRDILANSETLPARAVLAAAREAGVAERTLKRAKRREGVRTIRQGFGTGSVWLWSLPAVETTPTSTEERHPQTWPPSGHAGPLRPEPSEEPPPLAPPADEKVTI
ncbi:MAG TPA: AAA family ATPase [Thermoanaerobaculia bacterium]|nr:AAA family ATPase [Thermoanaerobaculia bacterium]